MTAKIYEFPQPLDEIEKAGGCSLRWPMLPEWAPPPPLPGTGFVRLVEDVPPPPSGGDKPA